MDGRVGVVPGRPGALVTGGRPAAAAAARGFVAAAAAADAAAAAAKVSKWLPRCCMCIRSNAIRNDGMFTYGATRQPSDVDVGVGPTMRPARKEDECECR